MTDIRTILDDAAKLGLRKHSFRNALQLVIEKNPETMPLDHVVAAIAGNPAAELLCKEWMEATRLFNEFRDLDVQISLGGGPSPNSCGVSDELAKFLLPEGERNDG